MAQISCYFSVLVHGFLKKELHNHIIAQVVNPYNIYLCSLQVPHIGYGTS